MSVSTTYSPLGEAGFVPLDRLPMSSIRREPATLLDGEWDFQLLESPDEPLADTWTTARVPSLWTMSGSSDVPHYTNVPMPFGEVPPHLPDRNPTGIYRRTVRLDPVAGRRTILHVGAAESALRVLVNGTSVGTSTDSHLAAEFDVTDALVDGDNEFLLVVTKFSAESYLEDQDHWWHGGISRSVQLHTLPEVRLADVRIVADYDAVSATGSLDVLVTTEGLAHLGAVDWSVEIEALGECRNLAIAPRSVTQSLPKPDQGRPAERPVDMFPSDFMDLLSISAAGAPVPEQFAAIAGNFAQTIRHDKAAGTAQDLREGLTVVPWSAEVPHLETVRIRLRDAEGVVVDEAEFRVGFRRVEIIGRDLLVNGARILVQGVARHDVDPATGRVMSRERLEAELSLLKRFNVNAIRTSHYPNDPILLDLADEYGLYVIDEADIEGHAFAGTLADDPAYLSSFMERYTRMVFRDRNHACVIAWSLGNETGYGTAHDVLATWSRRVDPTRPVHYEGAVSNDWHGGHAATDIVCPMYASFPALEGYSADERSDRPLILCEYLYSQGNGTGNVDEYWRLFETLPGVQGGFVWGFLDHSLDPDGDGRYRYGGDFGDEPNDKDTILYGIAFPDLTPKPAFWELRGFFSPVRITSEADEARAGTLRLRNRQSFANLDQVQLTAQVEFPDGPAAATNLGLVEAEAGTEVSIDLPVGIVEALRADEALALTVTVLTTADAAWAPAGTELAAHQVILPVPVPALPAATGPAEVDAQGNISHPLLAVAPKLSLWRAPTDNDRSHVLAARFLGTGFYQLDLADTTVREEDGATHVHLTYRTAWGDEVTHRRKITRIESGGYRFRESVTLPESFRDGPRVGMEFELVEGFDQAAWVGLGPWENYPDRSASALLARHESRIDELEVGYLRPQENGTRGGVTRLELNGSAGSLEVDADTPLHVNVARHTVAELEEHANDHWWELPSSDRTVVHLDIAHRGVGTARLGPDTLPRHRLSGTEFSWQWTLNLTN